MTDLAALDAALSRLSADYWYDVDHNAGRTAHLFFTEQDSWYLLQDQLFTGRDEIRDFYSWRESRGQRVARHCFTNARTTLNEDGSASMSSILLLHAADGVPILPTAAPIQIADVEDVCVQVNGQWQYRSRTLVTLFAGGVPITLPAQPEAEGITS